MAVTIAEMLRRFEMVDLEQLTGRAMKQNEKQIVDLNKQQLDEGVDARGFRITPEYSAFTVMKKKEKGQVFDRVTLEDTGAFRNRMKLNVKQSTFEIDSDDSKTPDLKEKYSEDILGLSDSGKKEAWVIVKPDVVQDIKTITGAK